MTNNPIAILGAGHGGTTMAADLGSRGYKIHLFEHPSLAESFKAIEETRVIRMTGVKGEHIAPIEVATTNIVDAIADVELVNVVVPALYQDSFFELLLPHLHDGQTIVIWAGDFGALRFANLLYRSRSDLRVSIIETNTLPYGTRKQKATQVEIFALATRVLYAPFPSANLTWGESIFSEMFPHMSETKNVLAVGLNNPNPIVHPPGSVMNVGWIQNPQMDFYLYRDGHTEAVLRTIREVYNEVTQIALAYECPVVEYDARVFRNKDTIMGANFQTLIDMTGGEGTPKGPNDLNSRYFTEDIAFGLLPIFELSQKTATECKTMRAIIDLACVVCQCDFWRNGRNLASLGLDMLSVKEIQDYIENGYQKK